MSAELGHGFFIWGAYIVSGVLLSGLTGYLLYDLRRQHRLLAVLQAQNTPRRRKAKTTPGRTGKAE